MENLKERLQGIINSLSNVTCSLDKDDPRETLEELMYIADQLRDAIDYLRE